MISKQSKSRRAITKPGKGVRSDQTKFTEAKLKSISLKIPKLQKQELKKQLGNSTGDTRVDAQIRGIEEGQKTSLSEIIIQPDLETKPISTRRKTMSLPGLPGDFNPDVVWKPEIL